MLEVFIVGVGTALATGLGAVPVILLGPSAERLQPAMLGLAGGVMAVAAIAGLLLPALDEGSATSVIAGAAAGVAFLLVVRRRLAGKEHSRLLRAERTSILVFVVLLVHSLPEGLALGTAFASETTGLALFVVIAIAVQNIPEGTSVAIPMRAAGRRPWELFWAAVLTSAPQPPGAVASYLLVEEVEALLPISFAFAAGAMLALVIAEIGPEAWRAGRAGALAGAGLGALMMLGLSAALGV
jgi:ZIP family zinc transporter